MRRLDSDTARKQVTIWFNDTKLAAVEGEPVAACLLANGIRSIRHQLRSGHERGIYCGIGHCFDCVAVIDGVAGRRTCLTPVEDGMIVRSEP
ncbi:MAG: (2Fe-2S)-binding protein [Actinomycetia bacterium]|nr:(2Fe-2S)-binding protein [Actinomycetes bacterium]